MLPILKKENLLPERNGRNSIFTASVDPRAPFPMAVLAQEIAESRMKLKYLGWAIGGASVVSLIVSQFFVMAPLVIMAVSTASVGAVLIWFNTPYFKRQLELWGHEVECQAALWFYGESLIDYRINEASDMIKSDSYSFDWPVYRVILEMEKRSSAARKWVDRNRQTIQKFLSDI